ncbi:MAG TPA: MBL fold metallo-hydrolase [Candidatus Peribacteraceae bacterium]|nr:MBL fold metallo-hydrolase [Candidatus Peribacteraceae bacterium]
MKITKYGHCCMLIEENGTRIITDPGSFTDKQNDAENVQVILITHEHADHFHIESVKKILEKNKEAVIVTNTMVGLLLAKEQIPFTPVEHLQNVEIGNVKIEGFGTEHAPMFPGVPPAMNTGYFINDQFFYPGDAFVLPGKPVDILALPVAGPWMKIGEAIEYALAIKPKTAVPVHDGVLKYPDMMSQRLQDYLGSQGIQFVRLETEKETEL